MALKDLNYKQFFFDHGERIGLGFAAFVMLLLVLPLIWPGSGFLAPSAAANATTLNDQTQAVEKGLASNTPGVDDKPGDPSSKLVSFNFVPISTANTKDYMIAGLFDPRVRSSGGRQMPELKPIKESALALVRFQLPALVYDTKFEMLQTLEGAPTTTPGAPGMPTMPAAGSGSPTPNTGSFSVPGSLNTQFGQQAQKHGLVFDKTSTAADKQDRDYNTKFVKIKDVTGAMKLAQQPFPVRAAEIVAALPYKQQIEEFREKLSLASDEAVLTEPSLETDEFKRPLAAFRFLGVNVQRRMLDSQGKPIDARGQAVADKDSWTTIDLGDAYKPLIILSGGVDRLQPEDPKYKSVVFPGLVMRKLPTFGAMRTPPVDEYPKLEEDLPTLKTTLDALNKVPDVKILRPSFTQVPGSIFDLNPAAGQQSGPFATMPGGYMPASGSSSGPPPGMSTPMPGVSPTMNPTGQPGQQGATIPDVCLIRLFDFTIESGKTYEYRMQVRMANPNYNRKDAASQGYASSLELPAAEWHVLPNKLTVPQDLYYYAVDQKDIDAKDPNKEKDKDPKEPKLATPTPKDNQTTLQVQKWVDYLHTKNRGADLAVGDWVIAERVLATRGEQIGRQRVEVPYWRTTQDKFTMASDQAPPKAGDTRKVLATMEVPFTPESEETILDDFGGGDVVYTRTHPKTDDAAAPTDQPLPISDKAPQEVLLYTYDGKLLAHNGSQDTADPDRIKRLEDVRKWIADVKTMKGGKDDKLFP